LALAPSPQPRRASARPCFLQQALHPRETLTSGLFGRAGTSPVRLECDGMAIPVGLQRAELPRPVDDTGPHRLPDPLAVGVFHRVLAVHVTDASLRDLLVAAGKRRLVAELRVSWVPGDR